MDKTELAMRWAKIHERILQATKEVEAMNQDMKGKSEQEINQILDAHLSKYPAIKNPN